ncbi:RNA polymerase II transcription regulator recruiting protein [Aureococcus anophagefferens]|nr:RNA polymerase II transcription regulator recruiting protein [Aureococcus anophagefferens]
MPWTPAEDALLTKLVKEHGETFYFGYWKKIEKHLPGHKSGQCRARWSEVLDPSINKGPLTEEEDRRWVGHLDPSINKGAWTEEEDRIIKIGHAKHGDKWAKIGKLLKGRPEFMIMNRWRDHLKPRPPRKRRRSQAAPDSKKPRAAVLDPLSREALADALTGSETMEDEGDVEKLRNLEVLYHEGALTAAEFDAKI